MHTLFNDSHMFWRTLSKFLKHLVHFTKAFGGINSTGLLNWTHYPRIVVAVSNACFLNIFMGCLKSCDRFQCHCPTAMSMYFKNLVYYVIIMILIYIWKVLVLRPWNRTNLAVILCASFHKKIHTIGLQCLQ